MPGGNVADPPALAVGLPGSITGNVEVVAGVVVGVTGGTVVITGGIVVDEEGPTNGTVVDGETVVVELSPCFFGFGAIMVVVPL
jgi:hypothetical protein